MLRDWIGCWRRSAVAAKAAAGLIYRTRAGAPHIQQSADDGHRLVQPQSEASIRNRQAARKGQSGAAKAATGTCAPAPRAMIGTRCEGLRGSHRPSDDRTELRARAHEFMPAISPVLADDRAPTSDKSPTASSALWRTIVGITQTLGIDDDIAIDSDGVLERKPSAQSACHDF